MKIAVSACLLGECCRYDGTSRPCDDVLALADAHDLIPICPEQLAGLPIPHPPCEVDSSVRFPRVIDEGGADLSERFDEGATWALAIAQKEGCKLAILKERSPSCASDYLYDGSFTGRLVPGNGITARLFRENGIRVIGESKLAACTEAVFATHAADTPTLSTERFTLRPLSADDAQDVFDYSKSPEVGPDAGWSPHKSIDDSLVFIDKIASSPHVFGLIEKETGRIVGTVGLIEDTMRKNTDALTLGYALGQPWWGKGYMTEAAREVIRYGFEDLRLSLITSNHYEFNHRSQRVIEKCGFKYEGTLRGVELTPDGIMQDAACYSITKEEYFSQGLDALEGRATDQGSDEEG